MKTKTLIKILSCAEGILILIATIFYSFIAWGALLCHGMAYCLSVLEVVWLACFASHRQVQNGSPCYLLDSLKNDVLH